MTKDSELSRRKFFEVGIFTISGTIAVVSGAALARFAVGNALNKTDLPIIKAWDITC